MRKIISTILILGLILSGCSNASANSDQLQIVTGVYSSALLAEEIGGDQVNVSSVYPPGSDNHSYEITAQQVVELQNADLVIITDPEAESNIYDAIENKDNLLILNEDHQTESEQTDADHDHSHLWLSPKNGSKMAETIYQKLIEIDSSNQSAYTANYQNLSSNLLAIDSEYQQFADNQVKPLIITHDAYEALSEDYGFDIITLYGAHHDDEPTTKEIASVIDTIVNDNIQVILTEQNDSTNAVMTQIAENGNATIETIDNMETKDPDTDYQSITEIYEHNLEMFELAGL